MTKLSHSILLVLLAVFATGSLFASGLEEINKEAHTLYIKPEQLDRLLIRLRQETTALSEEKSLLLLDTYKTISEQYALNNHYRQAYETFLLYLNHKENYLSKIQRGSLDSARTHIGKRSQQNDADLMSLQNNLEALTIENESYLNKISFFKRYFSLLIIILSGIFAALLISFAVKLNKLNSQLKDFRDKMRTLHADGTLGILTPALFSNSIKQLSLLADQAASLNREMEQAGIGNAALTGIAADYRKNCEEIIGKLSTTTS